MDPFLAMIVPMGSGVPTHPIAPGGPPPGIWPSPGYPAHPIAPGGPPPGLWPGGHPEHPIVLPPLVPGGPPIDVGAHPEHPIVLPPDNPNTPPPTVWPNPPEGIAPTPEHPIYMPQPPPPAGTLITWKVVWTPSTGWVVVGVPNIPHPVPGAQEVKKK